VEKTRTVVSQGQAFDFSVASYNVHRCVGLDRRLNPGRVANVINEIGADIIGIQEVDSGFHGKGKDQLKYLARKTGLNVVTGPTLSRGDGHYGNALLTSHDIQDVRRIDLSVSGREPRGALDVDISVGGHVVRVIVAHLGLGVIERRKQVRRLCEIFCAESERLEIMLGDFNEWFPKGPLCWIHDHFGKAPARPTFPSFFPVLSLDRIWVKPLDAIIHFNVHQSSLSRVASDHLPVKASVSMQSNGATRDVTQCVPLCMDSILNARATVG
jgi:endonuclease/exonuclease/phosphatase family metal-dependent hydrolase